MNLNNLTLKTQEAIQTAQQYAFEKKHPQIEDEHLFYGLLEVDRNVVPFLFNKLDVDIEILKGLNSKSLDKFSKVEGSTQMISQKASKTLMNAVSIAKKQKDEFVAAEHLLISLLDSSSSVSKMMLDNGITMKTLRMLLTNFVKVKR